MMPEDRFPRAPRPPRQPSVFPDADREWLVQLIKSTKDSIIGELSVVKGALSEHEIRITRVEAATSEARAMGAEVRVLASDVRELSTRIYELLKQGSTNDLEIERKLSDVREEFEQRFRVIDKRSQLPRKRNAFEGGLAGLIAAALYILVKLVLKAIFHIELP